MIIRHSRRLPTRVIVRPPILILLGVGFMVIGVSSIRNNDNNGPVLGDNRQGSRKVRTRKDDDVEEVDVKADGEGLALPSYWIRRRRQLSGSLRPPLRLRPTIKENHKKQKPISWGESGVK